MTATLRVEDMARVAKSMDINSNPVLIHTSPVHNHVKFSIIPRPSNAFGFDGADHGAGEKPGLLQLLERIYLRNYFEDREAGRQPKKCLLFFRGFKKMLTLHSYLAEKTGLKTADVADHVMIHSDLSLATEKVVVERLNSYNIIMATTRLLLGVNISNVDVVIFVQPFGEVEALVQGGGRGGRKRSDGLRSQVQVSFVNFFFEKDIAHYSGHSNVKVYQLANREDRRLKMSAGMKTLLTSEGCPRDFLKNYFGGDQGIEEERGMNCCHYHDAIATQNL